MDVICAYKSRVPWLCLMCLRGLRIEELKWLDMGLRCKRLDMGWKANSLDMGLRWQKGLTGGWDCWDGQKAGLAWLAIARLLQMAKGWHLGWDAERVDLLVEMLRGLTCLLRCREAWLACWDAKRLDLLHLLDLPSQACFIPWGGLRCHLHGTHIHTQIDTLFLSLSLSRFTHTHTNNTGLDRLWRSATQCNMCHQKLSDASIPCSQKTRQMRRDKQRHKSTCDTLVLRHSTKNSPVAAGWNLQLLANWIGKKTCQKVSLT